MSRTRRKPPVIPSARTPAERRRIAHARLLWRISRRYETVVERLTFGPATITFARVANPDRVLDAVAEEDDRRERSAGRRLSEDELHLPYWAELWDSAVAVGLYLAGDAGRALLAQAEAAGGVLDLGCGMGLAGAVAAALGARVVFGDIEPAALLFARYNSFDYAGRVAVRPVNWRSDDLGRRFGLIIGADILYERREWWFLEPFWRGHLSAGGTVLLGEPGRRSGDEFLTWIADRRWQVEHCEQAARGRTRPVRMFLLRPAPP